MMNIPEVKLIGPTDYFLWDQHVLSGNECSPYLTVAWKRSIEKAYGHKTFYLAAYRNNTIAGVLPLVEIKPPLARGALVSLPFCDIGGIAADHADTETALLNSACGLADKRHAMLEIRSPGPCQAIELAGHFIQTTNKCRMVLDLPESSERLWSGFKSKLRSQIRKARNNGLSAGIGRQEKMDAFYGVFSRNMRDLGSPVHSPDWIETILETFGENARAGVVYKDNIPIGAGIILLQNRTVTIPWASTVREYNRLNPNMLLYWTFLEFAADNGYRTFDFGRSTPGEGTYLFKKQWGARPVPLYWYQQSNGAVVKKVSNRNAFLRTTFESLWKRMPTPVANTVGPHLRKYISR